MPPSSPTAFPETRSLDESRRLVGRIHGKLAQRVERAPELPTDVAALQAMVLAHAAELVKERAGVIEQRYEIEALLSEQIASTWN